MVSAMTATADRLDVGALPLAPKNPLPILKVLSAARVLHTGLVMLSEAGGPVTRFVPLPKFLAPALVLVTSPNGVRDVLGRTDDLTERCQIHQEVRNVAGDNLFSLPNKEWVPRRRALQPVFTKHNVDGFGRHMTQAAQTFADHWREVGDIDLDAQCRRLAMRSLGRSILGIDINEFGNEIAENMHVASAYATDRALRPIRAPRWLPTPSRRRARAAVATMRQVTMDILQACRADPTRDAPLVQALIAATDPDTGRPLSDDDICNELLIFMLSGHDTTATMLTYALWELGHRPDIQNRVAAEVCRDRRQRTDARRCAPTRIHSPGAQGVVAAVPTGRGGRPVGAGRHRGGRLPSGSGQHCGRRHQCPAPGSSVVGAPAGLRP